MQTTTIPVLLAALSLVISLAALVVALRRLVLGRLQLQAAMFPVRFRVVGELLELMESWSSLESLTQETHDELSSG